MDPRLVEVALLAWGPELRLTQADGACQAVLQAPPAALVGRRLGEVLGVDERRARQLDARARGAAPAAPAVEFVARPAPASREEERVTFRLALAPGEDGTARAAVVHLNALLAGAPPVQLAGLSSALSHEIRNPLSSVKMAVQTLARNTGLGERDRRRLTIANREIRTMERMLWLLSEYGRDTAPNLEPTSARALVQEAAGVVAPELAERRCELQLSEEEALPRVRVDGGRLRPVLAQVLLGLAMGLPEGSTVPVVLRRASASEGGGGPGAAVHLVLSDPAAELTEEEEARLFEPFASRLARGAGLSLAALRRVVHAAGGQVLARRTGPEAGLQLTLEFPAV